MNKENGSDDKYDLKEQLDTVTRNLKDRDTEFKVTIDSNVFIIHLTDIKGFAAPPGCPAKKSQATVE